jgi:phosphoglycolate phosphatase
MPASPPLACLDLDGTLVDSRDPYASCMRAALAEMGLPDRSPESLHRFLGPPVEETAASFVAEAGRDPDGEDAEALVRIYREHYARDGIPATRAVPGVPEALDALRSDGWSLVVVTSKVRPFALAVAERSGLDAYLDAVLGPELEERHVRKATTLARALAEHPHRGAVMVGDRHHDVDAAVAVGIPAVGVTWAGDHAAELREAGAVAVVGDPSELPAAVAAAVGA